MHSFVHIHSNSLQPLWLSSMFVVFCCDASILYGRTHIPIHRDSSASCSGLPASPLLLLRIECLVSLNQTLVHLPTLCGLLGPGVNTLWCGLTQPDCEKSETLIQPDYRKWVEHAVGCVEAFLLTPELAIKCMLRITRVCYKSYLAAYQITQMFWYVTKNKCA